MDFHKNSYVKNYEKQMRMDNSDLDITPDHKVLTRNISYSKLESQEGDPSPSVVVPNSSRIGISPETPENYCPIVNAQFKKDWQERIRSGESISEFPLDIEEELESERFNRNRQSKNVEMSKQTYQYRGTSPKRDRQMIRNNTESRERSRGNSLNRLNKSRSKDNLGYKDLHGNSSIIKAFKNSP